MISVPWFGVGGWSLRHHWNLIATGRGEPVKTAVRTEPAGLRRDEARDRDLEHHPVLGAVARAISSAAPAAGRSRRVGLIAAAADRGRLGEPAHILPANLHRNRPISACNH
jgi:hypothetical protein